jgi:hypothetical protein
MSVLLVLIIILIFTFLAIVLYIRKISKKYDLPAEINQKLLEHQRLSLGINEYRKYLNGLNESLKDVIIKRAEQGKARDYKIEEQLALVQNELKKLSG